jgi:hypothetical protein
VLRALLPIAAGHALSVAMVVVGIAVLRTLVDLTALEVGAAIAIIGFGVYRLVARHRGRAGMQVSGGQLLLWSFLMATAHGAGLMLIPVLLGMPMDAASGGHAGHAHGTVIPSLDSSAGTAFAALGIHTLAMLAVAGAIALVVYEWVGLAFLRRGWINLDFVWAIVLIGAGVVLLAMALL